MEVTGSEQRILIRPDDCWADVDGFMINGPAQSKLELIVVPAQAPGIYYISISGSTFVLHPYLILTTDPEYRFPGK